LKWSDKTHILEMKECVQTDTCTLTKTERVKRERVGVRSINMFVPSLVDRPM